MSQLLSLKPSNLSQCNRRQKNFLRLEKIINTIREHVQNYEMIEGSTKVKKRKDNLTTVQLIQEFDLVAILEDDEISHQGINIERLECSRLSAIDQQRLYRTINENIAVSVETENQATVS